MWGNSFANGLPGTPDTNPKVPVTIFARTWGGVIMSIPVSR